MSSPHEPARGIIIPFPIEAIRRPPAPTFVTRPPSLYPERTRRRVVRMWVSIAVLLLTLITGLVVLSNAWTGDRDASHPAAGGAQAASSVPAEPPPAPSSMNLLIAGLDGDGQTSLETGSTNAALMLFHLDANRERAWLVSLPRDAWVSIPGHDQNKVDAAYAIGGPDLLVKTVERWTGLHVDHLAVIDWTGLRRLTNAVGGVPMSLDAPEPPSADSTGAELAVEMTGDMAIDYVSERKGVPDTDAERIRRQQQYVRSLFSRLIERQTLGEPAAVRDLAATLGTSVRLDAGLNVRSLLTIAGAVRNLRVDDITFLTLPVTGTGRQGSSSVVYPDDAGCALLWDALAHDEMPSFVATHTGLVTSRELD